MKNLFIWALLLVVSATYAQQDISVTVVDAETQKPIINTTLTLTNSTRNSTAVQVTNALGISVFKNIASIDGYQLRFLGNDLYDAQESVFIDVRSNQNSSISLQLQKKGSKINQLNEVVVTRSASAKINRRDAEVSFELKAKEIQEIPVEGRDITRVLYRLPNVSQSTGGYAEAPNVSINSANGGYTSYLIDGMDNNERFLGGQKFAIPTGFAKDVTVLTNNYSAEYGNSGSGVIDVTSKSGSNKQSGEVFFITRPGPAIDGESKFAQRDLTGNQVKDGFARYQSGFGIGGALRKDKTFYFLNYEHTTDLKNNLLNVPDLKTTTTIPGKNTFNYFSAKIDQVWNAHFRSSLRANVGLIDQDKQGGGLEGGVNFASSGATQFRNSSSIALKNAYSFGAFSAETNALYSTFRWDYANAQNATSPRVIVQNPNGQNIAILGHPGFVFNSYEKTFQVEQKIKYYAENHTLKAGFNIISADHYLFGGGNPNGNYTVKLNQTQLDGIVASGVRENLSLTDIPQNVQVLNYNVELRPASYGKTQSIYSAYFEDLWSVNSKLNLTLGLRYDYDNLSKGGSNKGDYNNVAPRLNFNYKINNYSSLRGGYAITYDKIIYAIYSDALQQNTTSGSYKKQLQQLINLGILPNTTDIDAITFDGNLSATVQNVTYLQGPAASTLQANRESIFSNERRILNPNGYQNPYAHQFSLGYQTQIDDNKTFFVDLVHNRGQNLLRLRNLNAVSEYPIDPSNVVIRTTTQADLTRPIPIVNNSATINGETLTGIARNVVMSETEGKSRYYALSLNFQKTRGTDDYAYRINYTLSSMKNDSEGINFRAMDGNNYANEYGPSINDRTHNINAIINYYPLKNSVITFASLLQSGQPVNRIPLGFNTNDLNGDGASFADTYTGNSDRFPGESRNNDRLPWSINIDLAVQHQFVLTKSTKLELRADIFNLFDVKNLSGYSNNATQSNQIQGGSLASGLFVQRNAGPPRQFQFGVRFLF